VAIALRPYQMEAVQRVRLAFMEGHRAVLFVLPTGGGKTVVFSHIAQQAAARGNRIAVLVHRAESLEQASRSLAALGVEHGLIAAGRSMNLRAPVQVASVATLARRLDLLKPEHFQLLVVDECFPAGTPVDGRPIETLQVGDVVSCFDHQSGQITSGRVTGVFCNPMPRWMVRVTTTSGRSIETTLSHPFFTVNHGYIPAGILRPGDELCALPLVRSLGCSEHEDQAQPAESKRPRLLQSGVLRCLIEQAKSRGDGENQSTVRIATHARQQPDAAARVQGEDERNAAAQQASATGTRRQWPWAHQTAAATGGCPGLADGSGGPNGDAARQWLPDLLQAGYRPSGAADRHRSGWPIPWHDPAPDAGQEEGRVPCFDRVERVEVYEPTGRGGPGELREGDYVYNIEVEQHHNYFAAGILVHNCHHTSAGTWAKALKHFCSAKVLGVTATPCRSDGQPLGAWFSSMVLGPTPAWLTENGYLAPARVYAPPIGFSAQGLRRRMGDFDLRQAAGELGGSRILGDAVSHYQRHLAGRTAIAFCCSIAHAEAVAEAFSERGIRSASIDGTQDAETRRQLLEALGAGELKVLTSCNLIGEGVDVPSVGGCLLLRPTQSLGLHLQMIGRCLRPQPGKEAVILDHVGNIERLGHHLDEQEWTLDGVKKREHHKAPSVKTCPQCFCAMASTLSLCPECGHVFRPERQKLVTVEGELREISQQELRSRRKKEQGDARSLEELIALGTKRGLKNPQGWARHVLAGRQTRGHWSRVA
jgi:DNA repair protein RadD